MPGICCISVMMLRPLIGSCSMRVRSMTAPTVGLSVVTRSRRFVTSTVVAVPAG